MRWLVVVAVLAACGRVGFDLTTDSQSDGGSGSGSGSDGGSGSGSDAGADAQPAACAQAIAVTLGMPMTISTCSGMTDRLDGCGPAGTNEVVFSFTVPATGGYNVRAYNTGTTNVSNSTGVVGASCDTVNPCVGVLGRSYTAGQVVYFAIEASAGGCATIDFLID
ncbi:MAG: hypothetical protein HOV81_29965 [Kofleriaceae bacterium]|nr:hypothetical protein [Kofleriaceae bacterium]